MQFEFGMGKIRTSNQCTVACVNCNAQNEVRDCGSGARDYGVNDG